MENCNILQDNHHPIVSEKSETSIRRISEDFYGLKLLIFGFEFTKNDVTDTNLAETDKKKKERCLQRKF